MELAPALAEVSHPGEALAHEAIALLWGGDERRITEIVDLDYRDHAASGLDRGPQSVLAERHALRDAFADVEVRTEELILTGEHASRGCSFAASTLGRMPAWSPAGSRSNGRRFTSGASRPDA